MNASVLVMSCDKYSDIWTTFHKLYKKNWKDNPYKTYFCTETKKNNNFETINTQGSWTARTRQALEKIDTDYVIFMLDDFFLRKEVDQIRIEAILDQFKPNTAVFNLELINGIKTKESSLKGFKLRQNNQVYLCSCQPSIWNRKILIELLQEDMTPWQWETQIIDSKYDFYINSEDLLFDIGYYLERKPWGIVQGKWATECIELLKEENIDFNVRGFIDMKLSIIIPYYKTLKLTKVLLANLTKQKTSEVEIIVIDDGCNEKALDKYDVKVIHKENNGVSSARNTGLDIAQGKYIAFIDSDDMIKDNYITKILDKINNSTFDYCYISWEAIGKITNKYIIVDEPLNWNTCVWNCIYKKELIGNKRFNEDKHFEEDTEFNENVRKGKKENIKEILYIYNSGRENSLTNLNDKGLTKKKTEIKAQIIIYRYYISLLGGCETAIYNACSLLKDKYDIIILYNTCDPIQLKRLRKLVKCVRFTGQQFECDTILYYSFNPDLIEDYVKAKNYHQQICCNIDELPQGFVRTVSTTKLTSDSQASANAFMKQFPKEKVEVLKNLFPTPEPKKVLSIMIASRLSFEKGYHRLKALAKRMIELDKLFTIEVFTNDLPNEEIDGFVFRTPRLNVTDYMWNKDYILQLSDSESRSCTVTEALERGIPVVCTDFQSAKEDVEDGVNGFILKKDLSNMDEVINKMYDKDLKGFTYNKKDSVKQWEKHFGKHQKSNYVYDEDEDETIYEAPLYTFIALHRIKDEEGNIKKIGEEVKLQDSTRIKLLFDAKLIKRIEE